MRILLSYIAIPTPTHADAALWGLFLALCVFCFSLLPAMLQRIWPRTRRLKAGVCASCGYSLFGLPGSTCPECGTDGSAATKRGAHQPHMGREVWIACVVWAALVYWLHRNYGGYLSLYLLRAFYGVEYLGATSGAVYGNRLTSPMTSLAGWYWAIQLVVLIVGLVSIVVVSRMRPRMAVDMLESPGEAELGSAGTQPNKE